MVNDHSDIAATSVAGDTTEAGDTVTVSVTDGVMTAAGDDAANLDTLAEWVDALKQSLQRSVQQLQLIWMV